MAYIALGVVGEYSGQHIAMECMRDAMVVQQLGECSSSLQQSSSVIARHDRAAG